MWARVGCGSSRGRSLFRVTEELLTVIPFDRHDYNIASDEAEIYSDFSFLPIGRVPVGLGGILQLQGPV